MNKIMCVQSADIELWGLIKKNDSLSEYQCIYLVDSLGNKWVEYACRKTTCKVFISQIDDRPINL